MCSHHPPPPSLPERKSADGRPDCKLGEPAASHYRATGVYHCCPRCHDKKKPWDMARPEQVLLLEPQHELKFRGNVQAEAGGIGPDTRWRTCALSYLFAPSASGRPCNISQSHQGSLEESDSIYSLVICAVAMTGEPSPCTTTC